MDALPHLRFCIASSSAPGGRRSAQVPQRDGAAAMARAGRKTASRGAAATRRSSGDAHGADAVNDAIAPESIA
eukprot:365783-Chlamydomonas_euryale.AAC.21